MPRNTVGGGYSDQYLPAEEEPVTEPAPDTGAMPDDRDGVSEPEQQPAPVQPEVKAEMKVRKGTHREM